MARNWFRGLLSTSALVCFITSTQNATAQNLVSHFTFDADYSNAVSASLDSPLQNGAVIDNGTFKVGGGAARFDGLDDFISAGVNGIPGQGGAYYQGTVAFWFKAGDNIQTSERRFMGQQNGNPGTFGADDRMSFEISTNAAGSIQAFIRADDGTESNNRYKFRHQEPGSVFPTDWANGDWHHLAFAWEADPLGNRQSQIYINGNEVGTVVTEATLKADTDIAPLRPWESPGLFIGARNDRIAQGGVANGHVDGWIDDLRVYDGYLDLAAIRSLPQVIPEPASASLIGLALLVGVGTARPRRWLPTRLP